MGALRRRVSAEELREVILRSCGVGGGCSGRKAGPGGVRRRKGGDGTGWEEGRVVCVTGGVSFVGSAIVRRLLARGYAVRLLVDTQGLYRCPLLLFSSSESLLVLWEQIIRSPCIK